MKYQILFYQKKMKKYLRLSSAAVVIGALRVNFHMPKLQKCISSSVTMTVQNSKVADYEEKANQMQGHYLWV